MLVSIEIKKSRDSLIISTIVHLIPSQLLYWLKVIYFALMIWTLMGL